MVYSAASTATITDADIMAQYITHSKENYTAINVNFQAKH